MATDEESIDYQIRIEAAQALQSLDQVMTTAASMPDAIQAIEREVQGLADRFGISFAAAQKEFQSTIAIAEQLRATMEQVKEAGAENLVTFSPYLQNLSNVQSPFREMGEGVGWKAVNDAHRESAILANQQAKSEAAIATEINAQAAAEAKANAERAKGLALAQAEQDAALKEADNIQRQIQLYGQVSRTAAESASLLKSFAGTQQGESILTSFFGNYKAAEGAAAQIGTIKSAISELSKATGTSFSQAGQLIKEQFSQIPGIAGQVNQAAKEMGQSFETASQKSVRGLDAVRIALGAIVAMIVFQVIQAFQQLFSMAITGLREMETGLYNLSNAEKNLSEQGIGITPQDLQDIIDRLQKLDPLLSKIQATELVSSIATRVAPQVGFNKEQIDQLASSIAILAVRNKALGKSFEEVEKQVTDAFLTGKVSVAINNLGIKLNDQIVKDEALRMGLVKTADEFDNLTGKMEANIKAQAMLSLISQNANKDLAHLPEYFKTADAAFGIFQARLQDLLTQVGQKFGPLLREVLLGLADILQKMSDYFSENEKGVETMITGLTYLAKFFIVVAESAMGFVKALGLIGQAMWKVLGILPNTKKWRDQFFPDNPFPDTPTGKDMSSSDTAKMEEDKKVKAYQDAESKVQDILQESADKKADIERDYQRKLEDINRDYANKVADIARDTARKREDALRNYNQKIEDINRDANQAIQDANRDHRQQEIDKEAEFQNRLRELRDKFLFDLEDALHERDARQVLRLIRQYALDKKNLEEKHKLDRVQARKDLAAKLQDIEIERQRKLEAARREYDEKLQEIQIGEARARAEAQTWYSRQLADANLWHQRQLQEQRQYLQRKLRDLAEALVKEYQLTAAGAAAIYGLLSGYFGAGGSVSTMLSKGLTNSMNSILSTGSGGSSSIVSPTWAQAGFYGTGGYAEGGTLIATRPTRALFGERGPEAVTITPLSKIGNNVGKTFGDRSAIGGMGGNVKIRLELSPDLEARIVDSSLDSVAVSLEKILREK